MRIESRTDLASLAADAAASAIELLAGRQAQGEIPCIVLTGGTGGARVLEALGAHADRDRVEWSRVRVLWGDERWVPAGHEDRNDLLADRALLQHVETDPALVHRVAGADAGMTLDDAATAYAAIVAGIDRIDLALNGVGEDGHVASLFPGRPEIDAIAADTPSAVAIRNSPKPPPERVTLSLSALNRAEHMWLIAAGAGKADAVSQVVTAAEPVLPAARLVGRTDTVLWADEAALAGV